MKPGNEAYFHAFTNSRHLNSKLEKLEKIISL